MKRVVCAPVFLVDGRLDERRADGMTLPIACTEVRDERLA